MMRAMRFLSPLLRGVIVVAALTACAHPGGAALDGTQWKLSAWSISSQRASDTGITAAFSSGSMTGHSGVNTYGGTYTATPDGGFSAGPLQITEMAGPQSAMRAERAYMTLLQQASSYKITSSALTLYGEGESESLIFEPAPK